MHPGVLLHIVVTMLILLWKALRTLYDSIKK